jgi:hypothetical protein
MPSTRLFIGYTKKGAIQPDRPYSQQIKTLN